MVLPVSDVDRAKRFYQSLGWRLDGDLIISDEFRVVQFTPPGSLTSIRCGTGIKDASLGSALSLDLVVQNVAAARAIFWPAVWTSARYSTGEVASPITTARLIACQAPIRSDGLISRLLPSTTPMATAGCCRRSHSVCLDANRV